MNRLFSLLLIVCPLLSFGQAPVLTFDEFYQAGGIYPHQAFHDTTNLAQLNGRDVIWDFSSFDLYAPYGIYAIGQTVWATNAGETPDNDFKEKANFFLRTRAWSDSDEPSRYDYLKVLEDTVFQIGESQEFWKREGQFGLRLDTVHSENIRPIPVFFNNFQYGVIQKDSFMMDYGLERVDSLTQVKSVFSTQYEGYGQLLLNPGDTIQQVIKVKRIHNTTAIYRKTKGDSLVQRQDIHYAWYAKGYAGEIISKKGNSILLNYPFYFKKQPNLINASVTTCSGTIDITLSEGQIVNRCHIVREALSFEIDLLTDGIIDSIGSIVENSVNYSFPVGNHRYTVIAKNECGSLIRQTNTVKVTRDNSMEMVCKENIAKVLQVQQDASYGATITAKELDVGSFNECFPADTLSFRIYHGNRSQDFIPEITNTAEELLTFLPAQLAFDCDHLQQEIVFLFAMHADGSWDVCHTELNLYSENDYCLRDSQWVKICVLTPNNEPISDVKINWTESAVKTNALYQNGCVFQRPDTTKLMILEKRGDIGLGVSAYDLFLINSHILGIKSFTQIEQLIAADINHSGTITAKDLVDLQRFLIGEVDFFSGNAPWLFFPKFRLIDGVDWALQNIQFQFFDPKDFEGRPYEFTAIKVGDVSSIRTN